MQKSVVTAMSKIATLSYKNKDIEVWIREKRGKHSAPYVVVTQRGGLEAHIQIKDFKVSDNTGIQNDTLKYVMKWMKAYQEDLLESWKAAGKGGKAIRVSPLLPKVRGSFKVRRVKEFRTNKDLLMVIRFENNEIRVVDFKSIIPENPYFEPLRDYKVFKRARADYLDSGIYWDCLDIDMEVAALYEASDPVDLKTLFK